MSSARKGNIKITSYANLLGLSGDDVLLIPLCNHHDFKDHPFHVTDDEAMEKLVESVKEQGVLVPILVRRLPDESFEIIAGHRRKRAAELAGLNDIPAISKKMDDDEAVIAMVDSNLQREEILPSEKAFSYKMKLEALKHQGKRTDLTSVRIERKLEAREQVAEDAGESVSQIQRYLRLTELVGGLLEMTDRKEIGISIAVELSYLPGATQEIVLEVMGELKAKPNIIQAERLKKLQQENMCTKEAIHAVLSEAPPKERKFVMKQNKLSEYFPPETTQEEIEETIYGLLEKWKEGREP